MKESFSRCSIAYFLREIESKALYITDDIYVIRWYEVIYIVNTLTPSMFEGEGVQIQLRRVSLEEAREIVRSDEVVSFIGHEATARVLTTLLGVEIPFRRAELHVNRGRLLIFGLAKRLPEGMVLRTPEEINTVGYNLYLAEVSPLS